MFTNKVNAASFWVGKEKEMALIKTVKITKEVDKAHKVTHTMAKS